MIFLHILLCFVFLYSRKETLYCDKAGMVADSLPFSSPELQFSGASVLFKFGKDSVVMHFTLCTPEVVLWILALP